jgi:hypothetical protein
MVCISTANERVGGTGTGEDNIEMKVRREGGLKKIGGKARQGRKGGKKSRKEK